MKTNAMNPYLPLYEYIPDGEPRIFGDRLYVYGSHDYAGGEQGFCPGDYMVWSAPLADLGDWRCDGVAFERKNCPDMIQDPGVDAMAAPDVVQGPDGRYYLYWNNNRQLVCRIAVSDTPEGPFQYYGEVSLPDGTPFAQYKMFDPGVLVDDDGRVYLFVGFCMPGPVPERFRAMKNIMPETSSGFELAADMKTIIQGPFPIIPGGNVTEGTGFEGHGFYEASSPRKINGKYVMAYSSELSHEMAYALSDAPLGPYTYKGALVSSGDFGLKGNKEQVMPYGNVHGGLVQLNGKWYTFYHRQTHGIECCRQGCAEPLPILEDGWFGQAEITSCGLNDGPLPAEGSYNACYCCHLTAPQIRKERLTIRECRRATEPHIYQEMINDNEKDSLHYIANITGPVTIGYKYFDWKEPESIELKLRRDMIAAQQKETVQYNECCGEPGIETGNKARIEAHVGDRIEVHIEIRIDQPDGRQIGSSSCSLINEGKGALSGDNGGAAAALSWESIRIPVEKVSGVHAIYLILTASEPVQLESFSFEE